MGKQKKNGSKCYTEKIALTTALVNLLIALMTLIKTLLE